MLFLRRLLALRNLLRSVDLLSVKESDSFAAEEAVLGVLVAELEVVAMEISASAVAAILPLRTSSLC